jgi:hypothetical protein
MNSHNQTTETHSGTEDRPLYQLNHLIDMLERQERERKERERFRQEQRPWTASTRRSIGGPATP